MSKHNRHNPVPQQRNAPPNPEMMPRLRNPQPERMVNAFCWWRGPQGWEHRELSLPESVVNEHTTQKHQPDILGMVMARANDAIERGAR